MSFTIKVMTLTKKRGGAQPSQIILDTQGLVQVEQQSLMVVPHLIDIHVKSNPMLQPAAGKI
ncbi:hypothetical protein ACFL5Z_13930, partial [Planctomycetota bacterium]